MGSFDLVDGAAELNVQFMYLQQFFFFCISVCLYFVHFSLESFDLVGGGGGYNLQFVFSAASYASIFALLYFQHFCLESLISVVGGGGHSSY